MQHPSGSNAPRPFPNDLLPPCALTFLCLVADLLFLATLNSARGQQPVKNNGLLEAHMAVSRDGVHFTRPSRQPYYPRGVGERRPADKVFSEHPDFGGAFDSGGTTVAPGSSNPGTAASPQIILDDI